MSTDIKTSVLAWQNIGWIILWVGTSSWCSSEKSSFNLQLWTWTWKTLDIFWVLFSGSLLSAEHRAAVSSSYWLCQCFSSAAAFICLPFLPNYFSTSVSSPLPPLLLPNLSSLKKSLGGARIFVPCMSTSVERWENNPCSCPCPFSPNWEKKTQQNKKGEIFASRAKSLLTWKKPGFHC